MSSFPKITLLLALLLVSYTPANNAGLLNPKVHVNISNKLGNGLDVTVHCKSKDDDIGERLLHQNESYFIHFHPNAFQRTLFYCSFKWSEQIHWFDIYDGLRDGCQECNWSILRDGPCLAETPFSPGACYKYHWLGMITAPCTFIYMIYKLYHDGWTRILLQISFSWIFYGSVHELWHIGFHL